jgi:hypothetical protein
MLKLDTFIEQSNGKFITVVFVKKDGSKRIMNCRLGVTKHLKGGECTVNRDQYVIVYDMQSKGYRSINRDTIESVTCEGVTVAKA